MVLGEVAPPQQQRREEARMGPSPTRSGRVQSGVEVAAGGR
jgi:hypothetical protein